MSTKRLSPDSADGFLSENHEHTVIESPRPAKRPRTASIDEADLLTPPRQDDDPLNTTTATKAEIQNDEDDDILSHATHVLATEAAALASITTLYRTSATAKQNFASAVETIVRGHRNRGKLIVTGVGKSAYIGQKLVATCKSLGVAASFMHACEAAHGDLGDIREVSLTCSWQKRRKGSTENSC